MSTKFHHINICAKDVSELEGFYREVFELTPIGGRSENMVKDQGYAGHVAFLTDGTTEMHLATQDLDVGFRTGKPINPLVRGHLAFRTDDIEALKGRLTERGVPFADFGDWAMPGWRQIFFNDPEGNVVEVHQVDEGAVP